MIINYDTTIVADLNKNYILMSNTKHNTCHTTFWIGSFILQVKMIQNQQQVGPVDQVKAGLLNGVGSAAPGLSATQ